ncbi:hypothetical protein [Streptomyces luteireticuli]|uniref:hypothetical protein n=1 Tax=Streptomyces luteireticuli TaxID=173858 RepID=UPI0035587FA7
MTGTGERRPASGTDELRRRTAETMDFLHEARASARRSKRRSNALALYGLALVAAFWGGPFLAAAARAGGRGDWHGSASDHLLASLPVTVPVLLALVLLSVARSAVWRGPVLVDLPTVFWVLPLPVLRGPLLLPRFRASALAAGAAGLVGGGLLGFLLSVAGGTAWLPLSAAGAWAGTTTALTAVALGLLVERHDHAVARRGARIFGAAWALMACAAGLCALVVTQGRTEWYGTLLLWSGPWGWAAQPLVAVAGHSAPGRIPAMALSAACTLAALLWARRETPRIPEAALRNRATVASQVTASLFTVDLRQARSAVRGLRRRGARPALRLPMPRRTWLIVPWRDATGLLRAPGRLLWAVLWAATALGLSSVAQHTGARGQAVLCVAALVAEYLAAAQLTEPARLDSDDFRRASRLPFAFRSLALQHAWVPGALLLALLGAGTAAAGPAGWRTPGDAVLIAAVPAMVGAALVSSYRGAVPAHVMIGTETPMGNTAAIQTAVWYTRGPLAALVLSVPVLLAVAHGDRIGAGHLVWLLALGAAGLWWARRTAGRLHGAPSGRLRRTERFLQAGRRLRAFLLTRLK